MMHGLEYENVMHLFVGNPKTSEVLPKFRGPPRFLGHVIRGGESDVEDMKWYDVIGVRDESGTG